EPLEPDLPSAWATPPRASTKPAAAKLIMKRFIVCSFLGDFSPNCFEPVPASLGRTLGPRSLLLAGAASVTRNPEIFLAQQGRRGRRKPDKEMFERFLLK